MVSTVPRWRQNPQRVAWVVLVSSFFLCSMLAVALPLGVRNFLMHDTQPRVAYVTAMAGTLRLRTPGRDEPTAVTERRPMAEGSQVSTESTDRGLLVVSSSSTGEPVMLTAQVYQNTVLRLDQARTPRFGLSQDPVQVALHLDQGRIAVASAPVNGRSVSVRVDTPQSTVTFGTGTYFIEIQGNETQVTARFGTAQVLAAGTQVTVSNEERVSAQAGRPPGLPVPAALNLVKNGDFASGLQSQWQQILEIEPGRGNPGQVTVEPVDQRQVVRFSRRQEDDVPNSAGVRQTIDRDVQGYDSLVMRLDLQLLQQSVPGGGYMNSEYPVMIDVFYTDIYGKDLHWYHSFYFQDLPAGSNWMQPTGEKIPLGAWYTYESPNLFEELRNTRPARINWIAISASGHDYDSRVSNVALTVR